MLKLVPLYLLLFTFCLRGIVGLPVSQAPQWAPAVEGDTPRPSQWSTLVDEPFGLQIGVRGSNGQPQLPHIPSGPWGEALDMVNAVVDRIKLFKRGFTSSRAGVNHLRPQTVKQWLKDAWRRMTFRKLKVTRQQYEDVRAKYRSARDYPSYVNQRTRVNPVERKDPYARMGTTAQYRQSGRPNSAFPSTPSEGLAQTHYAPKAKYSSRLNNVEFDLKLAKLVNKAKGAFTQLVRVF